MKPELIQGDNKSVTKNAQKSVVRRRITSTYSENHHLTLGPIHEAFQESLLRTTILSLTDSDTDVAIKLAKANAFIKENLKKPEMVLKIEKAAQATTRGISTWCNNLQSLVSKANSVYTELAQDGRKKLNELDRADLSETDLEFLDFLLSEKDKNLEIVSPLTNADKDFVDFLEMSQSSNTAIDNSKMNNVTPTPKNRNNFWNDVIDETNSHQIEQENHKERCHIS